MSADKHEVNPVPDSTGGLPQKQRGFLFYPSFREEYDCLVKLGEQDKAYLYLEALMIYGMEQRIITDDTLITMAMIPAMRVIDADKAKREKKQSKDKKN